MLGKESDRLRLLPPSSLEVMPSTARVSVRSRCFRKRQLAQIGAFFGFCVVINALGVPVAWAAKSDAVTETSDESNVARLPPLPSPPTLKLPAPSAEDVEELDGKLKRLKSANAVERTEAARELLEVRPRLIGAAIARYNQFSERAEPERLKRALLSVKEKNQRNRRANSDQADTSKDLLLLLAEQPNVKDDSFRDLLELVGISRVFTQIGSVEAARGLIDIYVKFGEFMRVDVQNRLFDLKDGAVAALIETRRHKADKIARWAERQLDRLGKAAPGEAVRTSNYETLADILRAYGRTKDPDAARVVVSYANSERYQVREAARQAVALMGNVALWQLREAYEDVMGKRPRRDFGWERTARELFFEYDRLRIVVVSKLYETGIRAFQEGKLEEMGKAYDAVLARLPQFDQGPEMAKGYFALAEALAASNPDEALTALVRVERLSTDETLRTKAKSRRDTIAAIKRAKTGVFDASLLKSAVDRDPSNHHAKQMLTALDKDLVESTTNRVRFATSGGIALIALVSIALILFRRRPVQTNHDDNAITPNDVRRATAPESALELVARAVPQPAAIAEPSPPAGANPTKIDEPSLEVAVPPKLPQDPFEGL